MTRALLTGVALLGLTAAVVAQSDPIATRKALMKDTGAAAGLGAKYVKGEEPFDLAKARGILDTFAKTAATAHEHFPASAKSGGQSTAAPAIWDNEADFRARFDAWGKDIEKAKANVKDADTFKAEFGGLARACGSCHQTYRVRA